MTIKWEKIDHFTGKPYKRDYKSGDWHIVDYKAKDFRITEMPNGDRKVTKDSVTIGIFKTLKAAKIFVEAQL